MFTADQAAPARVWLTVTPSDSVNLPAGCRALWIGGAGNVALVGEDNNVVTFSGVAAATILPIGPKRVNATNTTATPIVALY